MSVVQGHIIDEHCKVTGTLVEKNGIIYSCILNQTDIDANKNKFYVMQLIKNGSNIILYTRWGRISETGRMSQISCSSENEGIVAFEKQFRSKTSNKWNTPNFVKKEGKYFMSEISYEDELKDIIKTDNKIPDSQLPERTQKLISMLSDNEMMQNALVSLNIDTKKMPLGKIKQSQLDKASEVLNQIEALMKPKKNDPASDSDSDSDSDDHSDDTKESDELKELSKLSSDYYTYVPTATSGRKRPPLINTNEIINQYRDILAELSNIVVTIQIKNNIKTNENPIDSIYQDINAKVTPLDKNSRMWMEIEKYIQNTHGPTHGVKLEIIDIFEVEQNGKKEKFEKHCQSQKIGNKTLLFHGSPLSCIISIIKKDYYLNPELLKNVNIQIAGKMFGYGVYFADSSKSFNYTRAQATNNIGCYMVNEIALGNILSKTQADSSLNKQKLTKGGFHSTKGEGKWQPSEYTIIDDVRIPNGSLKDIKKGTDLRYNEYIVYDINQILIKYLIVLKNNGTYAGF
jgi:poly [ADP-ribose] polymerase 2/3/4